MHQRVESIDIELSKEGSLWRMFKKGRYMQATARGDFTFHLNTRLTQSQSLRKHAFYSVGLNYAGHLLVKCNMGVPSKAHFLLFNCTSSRVVHLKLVLDRTSPAFIRAIKQFWSRLGSPDINFSDNFKTLIFSLPEKMKTRFLTC